MAHHPDRKEQQLTGNRLPERSLWRSGQVGVVVSLLLPQLAQRLTGRRSEAVKSVGKRGQRNIAVLLDEAIHLGASGGRQEIGDIARGAISMRSATGTLIEPEEIFVNQAIQRRHHGRVSQLWGVGQDFPHDERLLDSP